MTRFVRHLSLGLAALGLFFVFAAAPASAQSSIRDAEIEELLRDYGDPLFLAAGLTPESVDLYVINDPTLNAFVAGGQNMFIHTGLILAAETPNELIGVMSHETGHIAGGHLARMGNASSDLAIPAYLGTAIGIGLMIAGLPEAGMAVMMGGQHIATRDILEYSRIQESAADQAALTYLNATGQNGEGLLTFFDRFRDQEALMGANQDPFVRSHPLNPERIALLERRILASPSLGQPDSPESIHRFELVKAKIRGFLNNTDLVRRIYPQSDTSMPAIYARSVANFREGRTEIALIEINQLIAIEPDNPYFFELKGQILLEGGRAEEAIVEFRQSVDLRPDLALLRINLAQALLSTEEDAGDTPHNQEALRNLQFAVAHDDTSSFAWYQLAIAHSRAGNDGQADLSVAEQHYAVRDMQSARQFAIRARNKLPEDSLHWNRAMDIIYLTGGDEARRNRRPH